MHFSLFNSSQCSLGLCGAKRLCENTDGSFECLACEEGYSGEAAPSNKNCSVTPRCAQRLVVDNAREGRVTYTGVWEEDSSATAPGFTRYGESDLLAVLGPENPDPRITYSFEVPPAPGLV